MFTDRDMRDEVVQAVNEAEFDVVGIVDNIQAKYGTVSIDTVPSEEFWDIVEKNAK